MPWYILLLLITALLFVYLGTALVRPEWFWSGCRVDTGCA